MGRKTRHSNKLTDDADAEADATIIAQHNKTMKIEADQINKLIDGIGLLHTAVNDLREQNLKNQKEIVELQAKVKDESGKQLAETTDSDCNEIATHAATSTPCKPPPVNVESQNLAIKPAAHISVGPYVKLQPLPSFDGKVEEWPLFLASYEDTTAEFAYSNRQNLIRLQEALRGEARSYVSALLIYPDDVPEAIRELQFNFGRADCLVRSQLAKLQELPVISEHKLDNVLILANRVRNMVALFKSGKCEHHLGNPMLLEQLESKLPTSKRYEWAKYAAEIKPYPTVESFSVWIRDVARVVSMMTPAALRSVNAQTRTSDLRPTVTTPVARRMLHNNVGQIICVQCKGNHAVTDCEIFKALPVDQKWEQIKLHRLCFSCLKKGHNLSTCRRKRPCGVSECTRHHHPLLHSQLSQRLNADRITICNPKLQQNNHLFKILQVRLIGPAASITTYAMFDEGSSVSLIDEQLANKLGLKGEAEPLVLQWYGEMEKTEPSKCVSLEISNIADCRNAYELRNIHTINGLELPTQSFCKCQFEHIKELPLACYEKVQPSLLLGLDNSFLGTGLKIIEGDQKEPIAALTRIGWVIYGPIHDSDSNPRQVLHVRQVDSTKTNIYKLLAEHLENENFGVGNHESLLESDEMIRAKAILRDTTKKIDDRYETGLLWITDDVRMPNSYEMAKRRLYNVESKMLRDDAYASKYKFEINNYLQKGYARLLTDEELQLQSNRIWFLPHFGVYNPNKPHKLRIVFDAAARANNVSLNSVLHKGPERAQPLLTILYKFRQGKIAVAGDIQEMFSQVKIRYEDQCAQRFLWRNGDQSKPILQYVMTSMMFGTICSPCSAEFVKNLNANEHRQEWPEAAQIVVEKMYVDDLVASFENMQVAKKITMEAIKINLTAGFKLRNFSSNSSILEEIFNEPTMNSNTTVSMERQSETEKVLGLFWDKIQDSFLFRFKFHRISRSVLNGERVPTKRELLGIVMAVFDPFGFLSPYTISGKLLMQTAWKIQLDWDSSLPESIANQWRKWWHGFQEIQNFKVMRLYSPLLFEADDIQLHLFVDASSNAFATVAYFRIKKGNRVQISFAAAKSRCAPTKGMSIPRLELQAAVLGCRLSTTLINCHEFEVNKIFFWCDSMTVVLWIHSKQRQYKQFVAGRITEILSSTTPQQWRWLPTSLNVADEATRLQYHPNVGSSSRWINGPEFLMHQQDDWPKIPMNMHSDECAKEEKPIKILLCNASDERLIKYNNFSRFIKLLRTVGWVLRFRYNASNISHKRLRGELTSEELEHAEILLCRQVQDEIYADEKSDLQLGKTLSKTSSLYKLTPFVDEQKVLRVQGRIDAAEILPDNARRPIILPKLHPVSRLIMYEFHHKRHHQNDMMVINEMRQKFWIPHAKALLNSIKRSCPTCIYKTAKPKVPLMGQLPVDRLTPFVRPFSYTGVDYCGPFFVAVGRCKLKRWISLFTCMTTRAVHLEVADDLSTDAFIICFRNFINRRGVPVRIRSDNGTNFVGAEKEIKGDDMLDTNQLKREFSKDKIEWIFNCPHDPSAGGCWERLVRCVKQLLYHVLKNHTPRLTTFCSCVIEAESIINNRPLTDIPIDPDENEPLTPNHFLVGGVNSVQTPGQPDERLRLKKQWRIAQNIKNMLWKRWIIEYLPKLLTRQKWHQQVRPLQPGQLVLILDHNTPRSQWKKGTITKVFMGADGQARTAEVRTANGMVQRPVSKLAALCFVNPPDPPGGGM